MSELLITVEGSDLSMPRFWFVCMKALTASGIASLRPNCTHGSLLMHLVPPLLSNCRCRCCFVL